MHRLSASDPGRTIDWGKTSADYATYRPGPPPSFYDRLGALGIGSPRQRMLDLGTGTGVLARGFARRGAAVSGIDISTEQIEAATRLAATDGVTVDFRVSPAEATPFPDHNFDCITANQCWLYFDQTRVIPEVRRLLGPAGLLVTSHFSWLPRLDPIAHATEALVLRHNPQWTAGDWSGEVPPMPSWAARDFVLRAMFWYDEAIPFTRESWRGRIRACRGVGAELDQAAVERFDAEHDRLLPTIAGERFTVLHRLDAHIFAPR